MGWWLKRLLSFLGSALHLQGVQNSLSLLQSGKVVGVRLDLLAELAGQSGYSSAHSQGNSEYVGEGGG